MQLTYPLSEALRELSEEELEKVVPISQEQIDDALERGRRERDLVEQNAPSVSISPIFYRCSCW